MQQPKLTREILEAVLDPAKGYSDLRQTIEIIEEEVPDGQPVGHAGECQGLQGLIEESPFLQDVIDYVCDFLAPDPDTIKREDLKYADAFGEEAKLKARQMNPVAFLRLRVLIEIE